MKFLSLLAVILLLVSCQSTTKSSGMTSEQLAGLICQCSQPIVEYNDELRALVTADNMDLLSLKMTQGDHIMGTAISCITDKIEIEVKNLLSEKLRLLIEERCQLDQRIVSDLIQKVSDFEIPTF